MGRDEDCDAARHLALEAWNVEHHRDGEQWRMLLQHITGGRLGRRAPWAARRSAHKPWRDTPSSERQGWRARAAYMCDVAFEVDYRICQRCRLAWVEQPSTLPRYQRCGLAAAGLAELRADNPGLSWHTLGGHLGDSRAFWAAVGADVPGGYRQRSLCPHIDAG